MWEKSGRDVFFLGAKTDTRGDVTRWAPNAEARSGPVGGTGGPRGGVTQVWWNVTHLLVTQTQCGLVATRWC